MLRCHLSAAFAITALGAGILSAPSAAAATAASPPRDGPQLTSSRDLGLRSGLNLNQGGIAGAPSCAEPSLTESADPTVIQPSTAVICQAGDVAADNGYARQFDSGPDGFTVGCVTFGIELN